MNDEPALFDAEEYLDWQALWTDMPEYVANDETAFDAINVQFTCAEDRAAFLTMMGEDPRRRRSIWYPKVGVLRMSERNAPAVVVEPNRYPVYVISKGRWHDRLTAKSLLQLGIPFRLVVEPQEFTRYAEVVDESILLCLPFGNLGEGSIPARNFVWDHATATGAERHWILDDNIHGFYRFNYNRQTKITTYNPFSSIEDWVDRYENVPVAGMQYEFFVPRQTAPPPIRLNTRIYSCILLSNTICEPSTGKPYRWRGRYNEDTDLCIRMLKDGWCSALFHHHLTNKQGTMVAKGGNTDELYRQDDEFDGRLAMAESLRDQHPDIVTITRKWDRWQHQVNYDPFARNQLIPK